MPFDQIPRLDFEQFDLLSMHAKPLPQWACDHRRIKGGPMPGPWSFDNAPMALEPMECVTDRAVEVVTLWTPAQLMKSEYCINVTLWSAYYSRDVLLFEPDQNLGKVFMRDRIRPAMMAFGGVEIIEPGKRGPKKVDSVGALRYPGGGLITALTPNMITGKSGRAAPVIIHDEIDKMGDATLAVSSVSRATTYGGDALVVNASTSTVDEPGTIARLWSEGSMGVWHGLCVKCDRHTQVGWERVLFEKDAFGFWLPDTARMTCEHCGHAWSETERQQTVRAGKFVHSKPHIVDHRSFYIPGPAHIFTTIDKIVREGAKLYRAAIEEDKWEAYQLYVNERLALVWDPDIEGLSARKMERTVYQLGALQSDAVRGHLDRRVVFVTAGVDVGEHELFVEFCAWGIDFQTGNVMCWALEYVTIGGSPDDSIEEPFLWQELANICDNWTWTHDFAGGIRLPAERVLIDCGYRPEIVRQFCAGKYAAQLRRTKDRVRPYGGRYLPLMSKSLESGKHPIDLSLGAEALRKRGTLPATVKINSNQIKDWYYERLLRDRRRPEFQDKLNVWPADGAARGYTQSYFIEMANERKVVTRTRTGLIKTHWEVKSGRAKKNDAFDARIYTCAAAMMIAFPSSLQFGLLKRAISDANSASTHLTKSERTSMAAIVRTVADEEEA